MQSRPSYNNNMPVCVINGKFRSMDVIENSPQKDNAQYVFNR